MEKPKISDAIVRSAVQIILSDEKSYTTSLNWAVNYCKFAVEGFLTGHTLAIQCLYILNNITKWRHPKAKEVRSILKAFVKEYGL